MMAERNNGGPAFPCDGFETHSGVIVPYDQLSGMSLRAYFAAAALQGMLANPKLAPEILKRGGACGGWIEDSAWSWADGMLKAGAR